MNHALLSARTQYRAAALIAATALLSAVAPAAQAADGDDDKGNASAAVLRTELGVSLLNGAADASLNTSLNAVQAPENADESLLTATVEGVHQGQPFEVLKADVANSKATVEADKAEASSRLVKATVNLPGLPTKPLLEVEQVTSSAVCEKGAQPVAESNVLGTVTVFGKTVELKAEGVTTVNAPGVGEVKLALSQTETTSTTAAGTALGLDVVVNPLALNVAKVTGHLSLVEAECTTPAGSVEETGGSETGGSEDGGNESAGNTAGVDNGGTTGGDEGPSTQTGDDSTDLAETGSSSNTVYLAGGAAVLIAAGGALVLARKRKAGQAGS